jgi:hypothetical protein
MCSYICYISTFTSLYNGRPSEEHRNSSLRDYAYTDTEENSGFYIQGRDQGPFKRRLRRLQCEASNAPRLKICEVDHCLHAH